MVDRGARRRTGALRRPQRAHPAAATASARRRREKTGRRHVAFGVRSYALATGRGRTTVAAALRALRDEPDPFITLLEDGRGLAGDLYELRIPDAYQERAHTQAWRPGRIEALHPAFRVLGVPAAFVYEVLDDHSQSSWDVAAAALLGTRTAQQALSELAAHGLAVRDPDGWRRGATDPAEVARATGATELVQEQLDRYRRERAAWRARLGAYVDLGIEELLRTPPGPREPQNSKQPEDWLPAHRRPPPTQADPLVDPALQLVLQMLGGTVLQPRAT